MNEARTLQDVLSSIRSKNAGPFTVTFDLFFADWETFLKSRTEFAREWDRYTGLR